MGCLQRHVLGSVRCSSLENEEMRAVGAHSPPLHFPAILLSFTSYCHFGRDSRQITDSHINYTFTMHSKNIHWREVCQVSLVSVIFRDKCNTRLFFSNNKRTTDKYLSCPCSQDVVSPTQSPVLSDPWPPVPARRILVMFSGKRASVQEFFFF